MQLKKWEQILQKAWRTVDENHFKEVRKNEAGSALSGMTYDFHFMLAKLNKIS